MPDRERLREELRIPKPRNATGRDLPAAIGTGVVLGVVVLAAIITGPAAWYPLLAVVSALATWEVLRRLRESDWQVPAAPLLLGGQATLWATVPFGVRGLTAAMSLTCMVAVVQRLFHEGTRTPPRNWLRDSAAAVFVTLWIPVPLAFAAMLSTLEGPGGGDPGLQILAFMLGVIASDIGGFAFGVFFGRHPMAPAISPKKSWEGFAGSLVLGIAVSVGSAIVLLDRPWWFGVALGVGLVFAATLGDLVESQVKRDLGIKDMSRLLPGHGGLMDRLDGMLPAAAITWILLVLAS
ncbi:phosphatidate cytidylyltransferase [Corynebacterium sphenisci]|uniref:phosphatidate cytidylyltransferase n=1 Tax=Corynebacterium sphenisci TaxID=191493 RepID=UPI003F65CECB